MFSPIWKLFKQKNTCFVFSLEQKIIFSTCLFLSEYTGIPEGLDTCLRISPVHGLSSNTPTISMHSEQCWHLITWCHTTLCYPLLLGMHLLSDWCKWEFHCLPTGTSYRHHIKGHTHVSSNAQATAGTGSMTAAMHYEPTPWAAFQLAAHSLPATSVLGLHFTQWNTNFRHYYLWLGDFAVKMVVKKAHQVADVFTNNAIACISWHFTQKPHARTLQEQKQTWGSLMFELTI